LEVSSVNESKIQLTKDFLVHALGTDTAIAGVFVSGKHGS
jgi:hypothetical protein